MNRKPVPAVPDSMPIADALLRSAPLAQLRERLKDSADRLAAVHAELPAALAPHVSAGPVDEDGWSLLAANGAVAAKLRQLQPRLEACLRERGWKATSIRIKVQSGRHPASSG